MNKRILKPQRFLILIPTFLLILSSAALAISLSDKFQATSFFSALFLLLISLISVANFYRTSIILDETLLIYQTFFRTQICELPEIEKIEIKIIVAPALHGITTTKMLVLHSPNKKVIVLIKPFSKKNLKELAQWLIDHCKQAAIDLATIEMSKGKMPKAFSKG